MAAMTASSSYSILGFPWLLLLFIACASATRTRVNIGTSRLGVVDRVTRVNNLDKIAAAGAKSSHFSNTLKTFFYTQTLDHFNYQPESYRTFQQRYMINFRNWPGGSNSRAPIFVFLGDEAPLEDDLQVIGFLDDNAPRFNALIVYIEHRYYGKSVPFGSRKEAFENASTLGYFSSSQALADYAEVIIDLKKNLSAKASPVIVLGGSYGGMLAAWFRLKYPHVTLGAVASSAPILYFDGITPQNGYYSIVTMDFREASESCYNTIRQLWSDIDTSVAASQGDGLAFLSQKFKTCLPLNNSFELKDYLDSIFAEAAQYNSPPRYPVSVICRAMDEEASSSKGGTDTLSIAFAGLVAYLGKRPCYDTNEYQYPTEIYQGWSWQTCSEIVLPIGRRDSDHTMFYAAPFNLSSHIEYCNKSYGVSPRPHWITTQFGGHDIKRVLKRFGSNIIFSNGLKDPYSSGGVLENISPSLLAVHTVNDSGENAFERYIRGQSKEKVPNPTHVDANVGIKIRGSHCLDLHYSSPDDPKWLVMQRNMEIKIIAGWLRKYYMDLAMET